MIIEAFQPISTPWAKELFSETMFSGCGSKALFYPGHEASNANVHTHYFEALKDCCGLVLIGPPNGLTHYDLSYEKSSPPEKYVPVLLEEIARLNGRNTHHLAVLVGGNEEHFSRLETAVRRRQIPIIGRYLDRWRGGDATEEFLGSPKKIALDREQRSVILVRPGEEYSFILHF